MKNPKLLTVLLLFGFLLNCEKDGTPAPKPIPEQGSDPEIEEPEQPVSEVYFTLNVDESLNTEGSDDWIFIHSESGDLIDSKSIESGEYMFRMESDKIPAKFTVTFCHFRTESSNYYSLSTFTEISKGTYWNWQHLLFYNSWHQGNSYGNFYFKVNDFDNAPINTLISNEFGLIDNSTTSGFIDEQWEVTGSPSIHDKDDYISTVMTEVGELKYYIFGDAINQDNFNQFYENPLSFKNDYLHFDHLIQVDLPNDYFLFDLNVMGYQEGQEYERDGYVLSSIKSAFTTHSFTFVPIGFLDKFDNYKVDFILRWDKDKFTYQNQSYSERPQQIFIPEIPSFSILNDSFQNFNFDTDFEFQWKVDSWNTNLGPNKFLLWNVFSSSDYTLLINEFPEDFTNKYPDIKLDSMMHFKSDLYFNTFEYSQFLELRYGEVHSEYPHFDHEVISIVNADE